MQNLKLDQFIEQCCSVGVISVISENTHNMGCFSAVLEDGKTIKVSGGDNLLGSKTELVGGQLKWQVETQCFGLLKMASGAFVQIPCRHQFRGSTLAEALEEAKKENTEDIPKGYEYRSGRFWFENTEVPIVHV